MFCGMSSRLVKHGGLLLMKERFAIPAVGAIIVKEIAGEEYILVQNRKKNNGDNMDGLLEIF